MKKAQRKAHVRAVKAQQKAARKAAREQAAQQLEAASPAAAEQTQEATVDSTPQFERLAQAASTSLTLAELDVSDAKQEARYLSDERAKEILASAAENIHQVIHFASKALKLVDPKLVAEAMQIIEEPVRNELGTVTGRPRRGHNPVVTLIQVLMRADALLMRILAVTNPEMIGKAKAATKAYAKAA